MTATHFLNADLDLYGAGARQLAAALAGHCTALHVREAFASLELLEQPVNVDEAVG